MDQICSLKQPSVLRSKLTDLKAETFFRDILLEMHERCPRALDFLMFMACPVQLKMLEESYVIQAMYAMAMYSRNCQLIAFQNVLLPHLLGQMHTMGLSVPEQTKLTLLDELGKINGKEVIAVLNQGKTLKITVDNIDGRIKANQVRLDGGNRDFHYTHWSVIIDRFHPRDLQDPSIEPKAVSAGGPDPKTLLFSKEEHASLRKCYSWLVQRILIEDVPALSVFCSVVHPVLNHKYRKVIMKDPKSLTNCVQIMDTILGTLQSLYTTAGRGEDFENTATIPLGGDQLTRVTFDSARYLRAGTHTRTERLEHFTPVIEELFHVQQDLLECSSCGIVQKVYFLKLVYHRRSLTAREAGSLANYRAVLHRTNVNGQVKANGYEAHKDFLLTVTRPSRHDISQQKKLVGKKVSPIIDTIMCTYSAPHDTQVLIRHKGISYHVTIPAENAGKTIELQLNELLLSTGINVPTQVENVEEIEDDVQKYSISLSRVARYFILFCEAIKASDINMITVVMKRFIPLFIGLSSYKSKYAIECVDFLTKTECYLSEYDSRPGKNKPAEMQQENNIKLVKHVIRGLGAGKTDKAMMRVSKAAPVVSELWTSKHRAEKKKKKSKSLKEDLLVLSTKLRALRPFKANTRRQMESFKTLSGNIIGQVDKLKVQEFVIRHSRRA
ncbi:LOW QUALITY PROTEIN: hypothetical protein MAR_019323, partial [Mya arenaria]